MFVFCEIDLVSLSWLTSYAVNDIVLSLTRFFCFFVFRFNFLWWPFLGRLLCIFRTCLSRFSHIFYLSSSHFRTFFCSFLRIFAFLLLFFRISFECVRNKYKCTFHIGVFVVNKKHLKVIENFFFFLLKCLQNTVLLTWPRCWYCRYRLK